jgi:hypothetical protein
VGNAVAVEGDDGGIELGVGVVSGATMAITDGRRRLGEGGRQAMDGGGAASIVGR